MLHQWFNLYNLYIIYWTSQSNHYVVFEGIATHCVFDCNQQGIIANDIQAQSSLCVRGASHPAQSLTITIHVVRGSWLIVVPYLRMLCTCACEHVNMLPAVSFAFVSSWWDWSTSVESASLDPHNNHQQQLLTIVNPEYQINYPSFNINDDQAQLRAIHSSHAKLLIIIWHRFIAINQPSSTMSHPEWPAVTSTTINHQPSFTIPQVHHDPIISLSDLPWAHPVTARRGVHRAAEADAPRRRIGSGLWCPGAWNAGDRLPGGVKDAQGSDDRYMMVTAMMVSDDGEWWW